MPVCGGRHDGGKTENKGLSLKVSGGGENLSTAYLAPKNQPRNHNPVVFVRGSMGPSRMPRLRPS
jgi:hypothetical protein